MRVIFLTHNYPRFPGDLPGAFLHPLALALRASGVEVRVVAPADRGEGGEGELGGVPVRRVRYADPANETLAYSGRMMDATRSSAGLRALAGLWRSLRHGARQEASGAGGAVVVHAHWWFPAGAAAPPELPLVVTLHGTDARVLARGGIGSWLGRRVLRRARVVTAVSRSLAGIVHAATGVEIPPDAIQPMPVDTSRFRWTTGGGGIVAVARLTGQKRLPLLVEAAHLLRERGRPIPVTIAGEGPARTSIEAEIARHRIGDLVRLSGHATPEGVAATLAGADLFVLPAEREGFGLAAAEALCSGVPCVVCRDGGGLLEVVPETGAGRVVEPDAAGLAEGILAVLDDPAARPAAVAAGDALRASLAPAAVAQRAVIWYRRALRRL